MLLYVTLEDVLGGPPRGEEPKRPEGPFGTLAGLFHAAMRRHARRAALVVWDSDRPEPLPDWKLDRTAIRLALFARERLGARPGERVAVFGRLHWLWPAADFAILGLGLTSVGIPHDVGDDELALALRSAAPRFALATDAASAARLLSLPETVRPPTTIVPDGVSTGPEGEPKLAHSLSEVLGLGGSLDTPEGARSFRSLAPSLDPASEALWHHAPGASGDGYQRRTHAEALAEVLRRLEARPPLSGDVACFEGPRVGLEIRLAYSAFIGDGVTTSALGGGAERQPGALRPHVVVAGDGDWLKGLAGAAASSGNGSGLLAALARAAGFAGGNGSGRPTSALAQRLGDRLRRIESDGPLDAGLVAACAAAGVEVVSAKS